MSSSGRQVYFINELITSSAVITSESMDGSFVLSFVFGWI